MEQDTVLVFVFADDRGTENSLQRGQRSLELLMLLLYQRRHGSVLPFLPQNEQLVPKTGGHAVKPFHLRTQMVLY